MHDPRSLPVLLALATALHVEAGNLEDAAQVKRYWTRGE